MCLKLDCGASYGYSVKSVDILHDLKAAFSFLRKKIKMMLIYLIMFLMNNVTFGSMIKD